MDFPSYNMCKFLSHALEANSMPGRRSSRFNHNKNSSIYQYNYLMFMADIAVLEGEKAIFS